VCVWECGIGFVCLLRFCLCCVCYAGFMFVFRLAISWSVVSSCEMIRGIFSTFAILWASLSISFGPWNITAPGFRFVTFMAIRGDLPRSTFVNISARSVVIP